MNQSCNIIIVNWNSGNQLRKCIDSIISFGYAFVESIIVVDNGSADESLDLIEGLPKVSTIHCGSNLGFGAACNIGAIECGGDFLLFLNPDARLYSDSLEKVILFMSDEKNLNVGVCGVQLVDESGQISRSCAAFPSASSFAAYASGFSRIFPSTGYAMVNWDHKQVRTVDHVIGAFYLIRRQVFTQLGGFDTRFFMYLEDLDLSYRVKEAGWSIVYLASIQAFHAGGGTSNKIKARRLFYSLRSRIQYAHKHLSKSGFFSTVFITLFIEPISRLLYALICLSGATFKETIAAFFLLWSWLPLFFQTNR